MRLPDGYKFTLQFKSQSDAHRQVGELLEHAKNKKSEIIVMAISEYIQTHPDILNDDNPVKAVYGYSEDELRMRVDEMILSRLGKGMADTAQANNEKSTEIVSGADNDAIDKLLSGIEDF